MSFIGTTTHGSAGLGKGVNQPTVEEVSRGFQTADGMIGRSSEGVDHNMGSAGARSHGDEWVGDLIGRGRVA